MAGLLARASLPFRPRLPSFPVAYGGPQALRLQLRVQPRSWPRWVRRTVFPLVPLAGTIAVDIVRGAGIGVKDLFRGSYRSGRCRMACEPSPGLDSRITLRRSGVLSHCETAACEVRSRLLSRQPAASKVKRNVLSNCRYKRNSRRKACRSHTHL